MLREARDSRDARAESRRVLGLALRELRQSAGVLQKDLAAALCTSPSYIAHLEGGRVDIKWSSLHRLLRALDARASDLAVAVEKQEAEQPLRSSPRREPRQD